MEPQEGKKIGEREKLSRVAADILSFHLLTHVRKRFRWACFVEEWNFESRAALVISSSFSQNCLRILA